MNKDYLDLYKKLGLQDPREFYIESCFKHMSCTGPRPPVDSYRRQTGLSTETQVKAIYEATIDYGSDRVYIVVRNYRLAELTSRKLVEYLRILGIDARLQVEDTTVRFTHYDKIKHIQVVHLNSVYFNPSVAGRALFDIN